MNPLFALVLVTGLCLGLLMGNCCGQQQLTDRPGPVKQAPQVIQDTQVHPNSLCSDSCLLLF